MKREDDGLGPNSWESNTRRSYTPPRPTPIADFLHACWQFWCDCWLAVVTFVGVIVLIVLVVLYAIQEQREWNEFAATHDCKVIGKMRGQMVTGTGIGANGQVVTTFSQTPDQTGYRCNDGVEYWR